MKSQLPYYVDPSHIETKPDNDILPLFLRMMLNEKLLLFFSEMHA